MDRKLLRRRIDFIRQGSEVKRWHTKRMLQVNDVGHHSFHVAWFAYLIYMATPEATNFGAQRVVMGALTHDLAEHVTGDVPGDFKRELHLREQFGQYEEALFAGVGFNFWCDLSEYEQRIVKFADMLDGLFFAISEAALGNRRVGVVFRNYRAYARSFAPLSEIESEIINYVDYLWSHYGCLLYSGQFYGEVPGWDKTAHTEESMQDENIIGEDDNDGQVARQSLTDTLRREEAEGRATPPPASPSKAPETGDASVPEPLQNDVVDETAQPDLAEQGHSPANARQVGGDHYKGTGYEHWDLVLDTGMNYFQGCATKYVTRARKHEGGAELNLRKAIHYIEKLREASDRGRIKPEGVHSVAAIIQFGTANRLNELEVQVIKDIVAWRLAQAIVGLRALMAGDSEPKPIGPDRSYYSD